MKEEEKGKRKEKEKERFPCDFAKMPLLFLEIKHMFLCIGNFAF